MSEDAFRFRRRALECRLVAAGEEDPSTKDMLLSLAEALDDAAQRDEAPSRAEDDGSPD